MFQERPLNYPAFIIPKMPNMAEKIQRGELKFELTEESKQFWEMGRDGQGYIGILELPAKQDGNSNLVKIHLIPAFNKDDGLNKTQKNGKPFSIHKKIGKEDKELSSIIVSAQPRGAMTGDLHMNAARILGLGEKGQENGLLMGFGIWKKGCGIRIISDDMPKDNIIPDEYVLLRNKKGNWELSYADKNGNVKAININAVEGLDEALKGLTKENLSELKPDERDASGIDELILKHHAKSNSHENGIKFAKNRSTSQNLNAIKYDELYQLFFNLMVQGHQSHALNLKREMPLIIFEKTLNAVCNGLSIPVLANLSHNEVIPRGSDALSRHLLIDKSWHEAKSPRHAFGQNVAGYTRYFHNGDELRDFWEHYCKGKNEVISMLAGLDPTIPLICAIAHGECAEIENLIVNNKIDPSKNLNYVMCNLDEISMRFPLNPLNYVLNLIYGGETKNKDQDQSNKYEIAKLLITYGADPNRQHPKGTLLHFAVSKQDIPTIKFLLERNVQLDIKNSDDYTALDLAKKKGFTEIVALLQPVNDLSSDVSKPSIHKP